MSYHKLRLAQVVGPGEHGTYQRHLRRYHGFSGAHVHDYLELFWVEKGPGVHWINGEEREVAPGVLQFIRPEDAHDFYARPGRDFQWVNVAFFSSSWRALQQRYFPKKPCYFDVTPVTEREFHLTKEAMSDVQLASLELAGGARDRLAFERFLLNALAAISPARPPSASAPRWLVELDQELRQQASFSRGVSSVVAEAGRCAEHVCREYRRHYGCTPTDTMTQARMEHAALLLKTTDMKIVNLALELGLENLGHFYRLFQKRYHCTPREYRMLQKRLEEPVNGVEG